MNLERMCMPTIPEDLFVEAIRQLVALDAEWVLLVRTFTVYSTIYVRYR